MISKNFNNVWKSLSEAQLIWLATVTSILLTTRTIWILHGWINVDSTLYFEAARLFSLGEWKSGIALFNWPLYSILIAATHKMTGLGIQASAQFLDVIFFAISTYSFLNLIRLAGGTKTTLACGSLLLFSSPYVVGDILPMLLRDQGFWAFFLTSLIYFIKFYRQEKLIDSFFWQIFAIIAILFRVEAISYLLGMPLVFLLKTDTTIKKRLLLIVQSNFTAIIASLMIVIGLSAFPDSMKYLGRIQEAISLLQHDHSFILQSLQQKAQLMGQHVLGNYLGEYAMAGLITTLITIVIIKIFSAWGWFAFILLAISKFAYRLNMHKDARQIFQWVIAISAANALLIILKTFVLSGRYLISMTFMVFILASFCMAYLLGANKNTKSSNRLQKWLSIAIIALLCISLIKNIAPKYKGYHHEQDAVAWVKEHATSNAKIYYNGARLRYYAGATWMGGDDSWESLYQIISKEPDRYNIFVLRVKRRHPERLDFIDAQTTLKRVAEFKPTNNSNYVVIYARTGSKSLKSEI